MMTVKDLIRSLQEFHDPEEFVIFRDGNKAVEASGTGGCRVVWGPDAEGCESQFEGHEILHLGNMVKGSRKVCVVF